MMGKCHITVFLLTFQMLQVFDSNAGELGPTLFNEYGLTYLRLLAYGVKERLTEQNIEHVPMVRNLADD